MTMNIKRIMNALAFADVGENLTLRQKSRHLGRTAVSKATSLLATPTTSQIQPERAHQQVALYMGSELPYEMMHYVVQTCARLRHHLTVLTFQSESDAHALLSPYAEMLASTGIEMRLVLLPGESVSSLANYLRQHPEIAFLACNETGSLERSLLNGAQRQDILPVPLVVVAAHVDSAKRLGQIQASQSTANERAA